MSDDEIATGAAQKPKQIDDEIATSTQTLQAQTTTTATVPKKKKILSAREYSRICDYIHNYNGLAIDCELEMVKHIFLDIERLTLKSIIQTELGTKLRSQFWRYEAKAKKHLKSFEEMAANSNDKNILLNIAIQEGMSPVVMCRAILQEKYHIENKGQLTRLIRYPHLIDDSKLSANIIQSLCSDSQDGPLIDLRRRVVGEEFEFKLKAMAKDMGMHYYDENDLRRLGYDKTPDIKMVLPFLYKGEVVNWIESKAVFGDIKTHKWNIQQQLNSYSNRFGTGIVIYWFGYHEETPHIPENSVGIIVLDDFPAEKDLVFLNFDDTETNENWLQSFENS